jgi:hypothetical protein
MYMQLSTGVVKPQNSTTLDAQPKYGIPNLILIVAAAIKLGKVIAHVSKNPAPKGFFAKAWQWIKGLFQNRGVFAEIGQDIAQIAANSEMIKKELMDIDGVELEQLIDLVLENSNLQHPEAYDYIKKTLPRLLDTIRAISVVF